MSWVNKCHQHVFQFYSVTVCMCVAVCVKSVAVGCWDFPPCHCQLTISHCLQLSWFSPRSRALCVKCLPWPSGLLTAALREKSDVSRELKCKDGMVWHVISNIRLMAHGITTSHQCFINGIIKYILKTHCICFVKWPHWDSFVFHHQKLLCNCESQYTLCQIVIHI